MAKRVNINIKNTETSTIKWAKVVNIESTQGKTQLRSKYINTDSNLQLIIKK